MTQTANSVWDRITGSSTQLEDPCEVPKETPTPNLSHNMELERRLEEALKEARYEDNSVLTMRNIIKSLHSHGVVVTLVLPQ